MWVTTLRKNYIKLLFFKHFCDVALQETLGVPKAPLGAPQEPPSPPQEPPRPPLELPMPPQEPPRALRDLFKGQTLYKQKLPINRRAAGMLYYYISPLLSADAGCYILYDPHLINPPLQGTMRHLPIGVGEYNIILYNFNII